ncbi:MAG: hypothetical protein JSR46_06890 [Verrucomicrobia bacterium]|nr:hypothetical protein [Verrucomicrobiota bacterium]
MEIGSSYQYDEIRYYPLSSKVRIHLSQEPLLELPLPFEVEVEKIWQEQNEVKNNLYNTPLLSYVSHDEQRIFGQFVEYRHFVACQYHPELRKSLNVCPLSVSGLCLSDDHILVGKRDMKLSTYGGYYECIPSGTIEARAYSHGEVDFFMQLAWELEEEAHIGEKMIQEIHPLGLFYDEKMGIYDIGMWVRLDLLKQERRNEGSEEYPMIEWMPIAKWQQLLAEPDAKIVPLSKALWKVYSSFS